MYEIRIMIEVLSDTKPKARKEYSCDASEWLQSDDWWRSSGQLTFTELRSIVKARDNNWRIKKGDVYAKQINKVDGDLGTFRAIPAIHEICSKHNIYEF
jgi:hypothetical protein